MQKGLSETDRKAIAKILEENESRYEKLLADYNPITGENAPGERERLVISDFAIPVQYVPKEMMKVRLVKLLKKFGSIEKFLEEQPLERTYTKKRVEKEMRRIRHKYDFTFWAYFQVHIIDKTGRGVVRFKLNYAQIKVLEVCERLRKSGQPINIIICKARQWGGSTFCIFYQSWIALKWKESHAFSVCAQTVGVASSITNMLSDAFGKYKAWDLGLADGESIHLASVPKSNEYIIKDSRGRQVRNNKIRIGSIVAPDNLRGLPGSGAHFSEVGVWPDTPGRRPEDLIKSITGGILPMAYTMTAIESTPKGAGNYFHREYMSSKAHKSDKEAIFIPWFYIPHDTLPIDNHEEFATWLYTHRKDEKPNGDWRDAGRYYWWLWELGATLEGIQWYRTKSKGYEDHADMASEAPSDDIEAFQYSGTKVFDIYSIQELAKNCKAPVAKGTLFSDGVKGEEVLKHIHFEPSDGGELEVWEYPDDSPVRNRYLVSVDVGGRGKNADWSVIRVFDRLTMMDDDGRPTLVAQMRYHTDHDLMAYDAMRIAKWYNNALLVIESNTLETRDQERDTDGNMAEYILNIVGNIYPNLYMRHGSEEDIKESGPTKWGFHTNVSTKPKIIGNLVTCLREQLWVERSPVCCDELAMYEKNNKGQFSAPPGQGNHDDVLMCTAIGLWVCFHEMDLPSWIDTESGSAYDSSIDPNSTSVF